MKKLFLSLIILLLSFGFTFWANEEKIKISENENMVLPTELNFTERFYLWELKELRSALESLKREIFIEIQAREIWAIEKALSYSSNAVSFFSILITILVTSIWIVWWKTISDLKKWIKESMDRETQKIIENFQEKILELEKEQKINILWRQYNTSESDKEKLLILDKIYNLNPGSQYALIERSNIYLSMWLYEKVIEITSIIISSERRKHLNHALFNRAAAYSQLEQIEIAINDITSLLQISPDYKENIIENKYFEEIIKLPKVRNLLKN